ncbi:hypothetical protein ACKUB1_13140 [Methanospirillum stamsii]|nr:hypothetical protein [Methanospirillum stamsii]
MTTKYSLWIPALLAAGVCIALCGLVSASSPQLPCEFYGTVAIQGSPAPAGSVITAYVNGTLQGSITMTQAGSFGGMGTFDERLIVMTGENDFANGVPAITFKINDKTADQTATYQPGASSAINLTVGGPAVTAPVTNTTTPVIVSQVPATPAPAPVQSQSVQTVNVTPTQPLVQQVQAQ